MLLEEYSKMSELSFIRLSLSYRITLVVQGKEANKS